MSECDHFIESAHFPQLCLAVKVLASSDLQTHVIDIDAVILRKTMASYFDRTHIVATHEAEQSKAKKKKKQT